MDKIELKIKYDRYVINNVVFYLYEYIYVY